MTQPADVALASGYRHIDTATMYGNEEAVGQAPGWTARPRQLAVIRVQVSLTGAGFPGS